MLDESCPQLLLELRISRASAGGVCQRIHPVHAAYIADYKPELDGGREIIEGADILEAVLGGDLDLIL